MRQGMNAGDGGLRISHPNGHRPGWQSSQSAVEKATAISKPIARVIETHYRHDDNVGNNLDAIGGDGNIPFAGNKSVPMLPNAEDKRQVLFDDDWKREAGAQVGKTSNPGSEIRLSPKRPIGAYRAAREHAQKSRKLLGDLPRGPASYFGTDRESLLN
jgi:hypothetical protein